MGSNKTTRIMKLHILASLVIPSILALPGLPPALKGCTMTPASKKSLDGKIATITDARWDDGIIATNTADSIRHGSCDNGSCKWIFHACHTDTNYNGMTFALENKNTGTRSCTLTSQP